MTQEEVVNYLKKIGANSTRPVDVKKIMRGLGCPGRHSLRENLRRARKRNEIGFEFIKGKFWYWYEEKEE